MAIDKQILGHQQGMAYAYKIVSERGVEALAEEIKFRGLTNVPITVPRSAIDKSIAQIKQTTLETFLIMLCAVLHDEFDMGQVRVQRAVDAFNRKVECLADNYCTWQDYVDVIKEELNINLTLGKEV